MLWTTTDGRSWSITVGDKKAEVWLIDEEFYGANVWQINNIPTTLTRLGEFGDIKEAKKACLDEIERINAQEEADKPKPPVILRGRMEYREYLEYHETVKDAAMSAYWAIIDNTFFPREIEAEGKVVWMSQMLTHDEYPTLASLAGISDGGDEDE
jgi:hypothetical protein